MGVSLELARAARDAGLSAAMVPTGQTGMMVEGWGVGDRSRRRGLPPGHRRVADRGGRASRRLGDRRGPGFARPLRLLVGDARRSSTARGRTAWSSSTRPGRELHHAVRERRRRSPHSGPCPSTSAAHEAIAALVEPLEGRRDRPEHVALRRRRRGAPAHRRNGRRDGPADGRSLPLRADRCSRDPVAGAARRRRSSDANAPSASRLTGRTMGFEVTSDSLELPFRDPFRIARSMDAAAAHTDHHASQRRRRPRRGPRGHRRGVRGGLLRRDERTRCRSCCRSCSAAVEPLCARAARRPADGDRGRSSARPTRWTVRSATTAAPRPGSTSRSTISSASASASRCYELLGLSPDLPPTDFTIGIDEPEVVAQRAARAAHFPALKIKLGGPKDLATLEAVRACSAARSGSTRTPAGSPRPARDSSRNWSGSASS